MKYVWVVGINSCENNNVRAICATEVIAKRELFKARDEMIGSIEYQIKIQNDGIKLSYQKQKVILSNNDPREWKVNAPYDFPYLSKAELLEEVAPRTGAWIETAKLG